MDVNVSDGRTNGLMRRRREGGRVKEREKEMGAVMRGNLRMHDY